ncbi:hypothetical protein [Paenibacillus medicaginis]|uniref:Uncharacterized protein n=1 Tax=Paenibacillus medicaginis TaxID=1470560 RepID=A0ABV5BUV3_9BACL
MDKLEAAIKKVQRYELKYNNHYKKIKEKGIDEKIFWATFPPGSEERKLLIELNDLNENVRRAKNELKERERIESKKIDRVNSKNTTETKNENKTTLWMQSKTGTWHKFGFEIGNEKYANCQSYNLDKPNYLNGDGLEIPPTGAKICKKCSGQKSGEHWE